MRPDVPEELSQLIAQALARLPEDRPQSMQELAGRLERCRPDRRAPRVARPVEGASKAATPSATPSVIVTPSATATPTLPRILARLSPRARVALALASLLLGCATAAWIGTALRVPPPPPAHAAAARPVDHAKPTKPQTTPKH